MDKQNFLRFVSQAEWRFAKSVPNWPHFYIVEENLPDQAAFRAARAFVRESGRVGKFFDIDVFYFDADGWTYWASPLAKPPESQYMLNKCKTEYSYEACPELNRGDEHLVEVLYRKTIITADQIVRESLVELKKRIADYFDTELKKDLDESVKQIGKALDSIAGFGA